MVGAMIPTIETERLRLRRWEMRDFEPFAALRTTAELQRFVGGPMGRERAREDFCKTMKTFHWQGWDLLLTPSLPIPAFDVGLEKPPEQGESRWVDWTPFTYPFNLTGQPAASVPCGLTEAGLPVGLQIVGPQFADARVLQAAAAFEAAAPFPLPAA